MEALEKKKANNLDNGGCKLLNGETGRDLSFWDLRNQILPGKLSLLD